LAPCCNPRRFRTSWRVKEAIELFAHFYKRRANTSDLLKKIPARRKKAARTIASFPADRSRGWRWPWLWSTIRKLYSSTSRPAGLDPQVRREMYDIVEELKRERKTILLTTPLHRRSRTPLRPVWPLSITGASSHWEHRANSSMRPSAARASKSAWARPMTDGLLAHLEGVSDCPRI